jgi:hypothetical protein
VAYVGRVVDRPVWTGRDRCGVSVRRALDESRRAGLDGGEVARWFHGGTLP